MVFGVLQLSRTADQRKLKKLDNLITDSLNEAKDNVKYLLALQKHAEPLYNNDPHAIIEALPGLMNNLKMVLTIARYYSSNDRMTILLCKITNQIIASCVKFVTSKGKVWDQERDKLIESLQICIKVNDCYQEQYRLAKVCNFGVIG